MRRCLLSYELSVRPVRMVRLLSCIGWLAAAWLVIGASMTSAAEWIWSPQHTAGQVPQESCYFRTSFTSGDYTAAKLVIAGDDAYEVYLNGKRIIQGSGWEDPKAYNVQPHVEQGDNILAIKVTNTQGRTAGLVCSVELTQRNGQSLVHASDTSWKTSVSPLPFWHLPRYTDARWDPAQSMGEDGQAKPWIRENAVAANNNDRRAANTATDADQVAQVDTARPSPNRQPPPRRQATPSNAPKFRTQPDFEVQILATHDQTGSLIAVEFNEFHELLLAQENGPLLLMVDTNDDQIPDSPRVYCDQVKNVQGILPLNGDVFVTADGPSGPALYRLSDKNRDGKLEVAAALIKFRHIAGGEDAEMGEHGPHGLAIGPDGNIYVVVGNHAEVEGTVAESSPYRNTYEGDIIPRFEDPGGHAVGVSAPGGMMSPS